MVIKYRAKPDEDESREAKIQFWKNKLGWKMPVTLRYGVTFGATFGAISLFRKRRIERFLGHVAFWTPAIGLGLCYYEFYQLLLAYQLPK